MSINKPRIIRHAALRRFLTSAMSMSALGLLPMLMSCGGSSDAHKTYSVSGTVSGLTTDGLVLANGSTTTAITPGATSFTFQTPIADGSAYSVVVQAQPSERDQVCTVTTGSGTVISANIINVLEVIRK